MLESADIRNHWRGEQSLGIVVHLRTNLFFYSSHLQITGHSRSNGVLATLISSPPLSLMVQLGSTQSNPPTTVSMVMLVLPLLGLTAPISSTSPDFPDPLKAALSPSNSRLNGFVVRRRTHSGSEVNWSLYRIYRLPKERIRVAWCMCGKWSRNGIW